MTAFDYLNRVSSIDIIILLVNDNRYSADNSDKQLNWFRYRLLPGQQLWETVGDITMAKVEHSLYFLINSILLKMHYLSLQQILQHFFVFAQIMYSLSLNFQVMDFRKSHCSLIFKLLFLKKSFTDEKKSSR